MLVYFIIIFCDFVLAKDKLKPEKLGFEINFWYDFQILYHLKIYMYIFLRKATSAGTQG